jgi:lactam utilization protein B
MTGAHASFKDLKNTSRMMLMILVSVAVEESARWQIANPFAKATKKTVERAKNHRRINDDHRKPPERVDANGVHSQWRFDGF